MKNPTTAIERAQQNLTSKQANKKGITVSKVLDDAKATAESANALVTEIETSEQEGTVTPVDKTVTSVVLNYSDGTSVTLSPPASDTAPPTATDEGTVTESDSGSGSSSDTPADSGSGEPVAAPEPVAAGTIPS